MSPGKKNSKPVFEQLLEKLVHENFFTEEGIKKIYDIESSRRNAGNKNLSPISDKGSSSLTAAIKPFKLGSDSKNGEKNYMPVQFHLNDERDRIPSSLPGSSKEYSSNSKMKTPGILKNSYEVSELAVTEYSVTSDFLNEFRDDGSDEDETYKPATKMFENDRKSLIGRDPAELDRELAGSSPQKNKKIKEEEPNSFKYDRRNKIFRSVNAYPESLDDVVGNRSIKLEYD